MNAPATGSPWRGLLLAAVLTMGLTGATVCGAQGREDLTADVVLSATRFRTDGKDLLLPGSGHVNDSVAVGTDQERFPKLYAKASYGAFTLTGMHSERHNGLLRRQFGTVFDDPASNSIDRSTAIDLTHAGHFQQFAVTTRVFYGDHTSHGDQLYPTELDLDAAHGRWWGSEVKAVGTVTDRHKLLLGAQHQDNTRQVQRTFAVEPFVSYYDDRRSPHTLGVYIQDEYAMRPDLLLTAGARYDHGNASAEDNLSSRVALVYKVAAATTAKLLHGRAFRNPNASESYHSFPALQIGNANPGAERIRSTQAIVEHQRAPGLRLTGVLFANTIDGLIQPLAEAESALLQFQNQPEFETRGAELELERHFGDRAKIRANYTWQNADASAGLTNAPRHLAKLNIVGPVLSDRLSAGLESHYTSVRRSAQADVGAFAVANLTLRYRARSLPLELSASIYNLFDKNYADPVAPDPGVPLRDVVVQDGRTVQLQAVFRL